MQEIRCLCLKTNELACRFHSQIHYGADQTQRWTLVLHGVHNAHLTTTIRCAESWERCRWNKQHSERHGIKFSEGTEGKQHDKWSKNMKCNIVVCQKMETLRLQNDQAPNTPALMKSWPSEHLFDAPQRDSQNTSRLGHCQCRRVAVVLTLTGFAHHPSDRTQHVVLQLCQQST